MEDNLTGDTIFVEVEYEESNDFSYKVTKVSVHPSSTISDDITNTDLENLMEKVKREINEGKIKLPDWTIINQNDDFGFTFDGVNINDGQMMDMSNTYQLKV
jgi:hypothetical protein